MAETGMMAINRYRLRALERAGNRGARLAAELLRQTDRLLSMLLAGNTLVNAVITILVGVRFPEQTALAASYVLKPLVKGFSWTLWIANIFVRGLLWLLRIPIDPGPQRLSMEELRFLVLESGQFMPKKHQSILVNLFELEAITVEDVMTPRSQIGAIDLEAPAESILAQLTTAYHTRLPAYRGELGNLAGILHLRKVMHLV